MQLISEKMVFISRTIREREKQQKDKSDCLRNLH